MVKYRSGLVKSLSISSIEIEEMADDCFSEFSI
jgi:hypothetical protein